MHTLLGVSSLLLVLAVCAFLLRRLGKVGDLSSRRALQLLVLAAPVLSLAVALLGVHHFTGQTCFLVAPPWDYTLGLALPLGMATIALAGALVALFRSVMLSRLVAHRPSTVSPELQAMGEQLSQQLGVSDVPVRVCVYDRPLALTVGLLQSTVLLSSWMVEHLDREELESVLAHELSHAARRDALVAWVSTLLRDAFFYLPTSHLAHRQIQQERELACDELAVEATARPLALASALAKVWEHTAAGRGCEAAATALLNTDQSVESRITRLVAESPGIRPTRSAGKPGHAPWVGLGLGGASLAVLVALQAANVALVLAPMGCSPASALIRLL